jgi:beta-glucosidase
MFNSFPIDFYWGASTSAYQVEGGIEDNNWGNWVEEHSVIEIEKYRKDRPEYMLVGENYRDAKDPTNYIPGNVVNSVNRYKDDVNALKELGLNSYRFSVEWSRVEPQKGIYSKEGIKYYKNLVKELKDAGIEPFVTCWHWTIPSWLEDEGGLTSPNIPVYFEGYVKFLVENLGDDVKYWMTINEPMVVSGSSFLSGVWPPQKRNPILFYKAINNLVKMHKSGYSVIKEYDEDLQVSIAKNNAYFEPKADNLLNKGIVNIVRYFWNYWFLDRVKDSLDYIGLNYYFNHKISIWGLKNEKEPQNDMGWYMNPSGIYYPLMELEQRYGLPIYITENGVADREDKFRTWWLDETFKAMSEVLEDGVDLRGYMHWSLIDNFEWGEGFWPRFGLVDIDRNIKDSGWYYKDLLESLK